MKTNTQKPCRGHLRTTQKATSYIAQDSNIKNIFGAWLLKLNNNKCNIAIIQINMLFIHSESPFITYYTHNPKKLLLN